MPVYLWSQVPNNNGSADPTFTWAEGQPPSSVNDSARSMVAALAKYFGDITGAIVSTGTSSAYAVTSYSAYDTLAHLNGQMVAFSPHVTNAATVTLNVDGLGAKPLRSSPGVELQSNSLIAGTPYTAVYNNSDGAFYLEGNAGATYGIPLGGGLPFFLPTAPSSAFVFPFGQAVSRTTYATLFAAMGTTYGVGDGSTTFGLPDLRGRVPAGLDNMGGSAASRLTTAGGGVDGATLGASGGVQNVALAANQIPSLTSVNASQAISVTGTSVLRNPPDQSLGGGGTGFGFQSLYTLQSLVSTGNNSISVTYTNGSQVVTKTVQPTLAVNYILRVI